MSLSWTLYTLLFKGIKAPVARKSHAGCRGCQTKRHQRLLRGPGRLGLDGLSNDELRVVAQTTVSPVHIRRLKVLLAVQRRRNLTESEQQEATKLVEQEDLLTLRRSKALLLRKRRGALTGDLTAFGV